MNMQRENTRETNIMMLINEISKLFFDRMRHSGEQGGLKRGYNHFLFHLYHKDGISQLELSRLTHLKAPTVSVTLQKMEADGLVRREADDSDLRQTRVYLTEEGKGLYNLLRQKIRETEEEFISGIDSGDIKVATDILKKIRDNYIARK